MKFLDLTLATPEENIALDEALLLAAEDGAGGEMLRVWESHSPCVILGAASSLAADVNEDTCTADRVPILRRSSGGGTVLLGPGCLLYSVVLSYDRATELRQIRASYCYILEALCTALDIPSLQPAGISDLAIGSRKVSGNSQQRKRDFLLHHGSLLYGFDSASAERYLRMPARQPEYRQRRRDTDFLANIPLSRSQIVQKLRLAFAADEELKDWPIQSVRQLVDTKHFLPEWTRRR